MKTLKLAAVMTALLGSMSANAAGTIDLFTSATTHVVSVAGNQANGTTDFNQVSDAGAGTILGGFRDIEVELVSGDGNPNNDVNMNVFGGELSFSAGAGITGKGTIQWDGGDNSATLDTDGLNGGLGVDFSALGEAFSFEVISADHPFTFAITLYDIDGEFVTFDLSANTGAHTTEIAFDLFSTAHSTLAANGGCGASNVSTTMGSIISTTCSAGDLDLSKIGALQVEIGTNGGVTELDLKIGPITATNTVPEPSSLALIGLGLMATGFASKRKSNKA